MSNKLFLVVNPHLGHVAFKPFKIREKDKEMETDFEHKLLEMWKKRKVKKMCEKFHFTRCRLRKRDLHQTFPIFSLHLGMELALHQRLVTLFLPILHPMNLVVILH